MVAAEVGPPPRRIPPEVSSALTPPPTRSEWGATFMIFVLIATMMALNGAALYWHDSLYADLLIGDMDAGLLMLGVFVFVFKLRSLRLKPPSGGKGGEIDFEI